MLKKLIFVLLLLASMTSFSETAIKTHEKNVIPVPTEKTAPAVNGHSSALRPDIIKPGHMPKLEDFVRTLPPHHQIIIP